MITLCFLSFQHDLLFDTWDNLRVEQGWGCWHESLCSSRHKSLRWTWSNGLTGVFLYPNRAIHGSLPSRRAFLNKLLVTLTADSALPFDLWWCGEDVTCLNSHSPVHRLNSRLTSCDPLSDTSTSGNNNNNNNFIYPGKKNRSVDQDIDRLVLIGDQYKKHKKKSINNYRDR